MEAELWFGEPVIFLANVKELPACLTIQRVYEMYREACDAGLNKPLQMTQFQQTWKCSFPEVVIPKVSNGYDLYNIRIIVGTFVPRFMPSEGK